MICISEGRFCPSFYEKMQKNSIFFAKHLVSSKKCSTFAPLFRRRVRRQGETSRKVTRLFSSVGQST